MSDRLRFILMATAVMAALQVPALAQEKPAPPPAQGPAAKGPPQASPPREQPSSPNQETTDHGRFVFHPVSGGFLRLDMATGAVASCTPDGTAWNCVAGRDERTALDREIARLQRDNAVLKNALLERGVPLPGGMAPNPPTGAAGAGSDEPVLRPPQTVPPTPAAPGTPPPGAESEFDHIVDAVGRGWRRLVETMSNLRRDLEQLLGANNAT